MSNKKHIVITGPESTGKSTLSRYLARIFDGFLVEEYAREYLSERNGVYNREDLSKIAFRQFQSQLAALNNDEHSVVFSDTCLLTIRIWDEWKFGMIDSFVEEWIGLQQVDLYLLCSPDLPWQDDELRESEYDRDELFEIYLEKIIESGVPYAIIEGIDESRNVEAAQIVSTFLSE